jgi:hypothetical protein
MEDIPQDNHIVPAIPKTLTLDMALYEHYLEDSLLSDPEKQELLQMLWNLMCEFVLLGFGVSPIQQVIQAKAVSAANFATGLDLDQVESSCKTVNEQGGYDA